MMKSSMSKIEPNDADDVPVVSEGGRSPSPPREDEDVPRSSGFPWHLLLNPPQPAPA